MAQRLILTLLLPALAGPLAAQETHRVRFADGASSAELTGVVVGDTYVDYVLEARAGQTMSVAFAPESNAYFNVMPPGSTGEAIFNGSLAGESFTGRLPADGAYRLRVYQMGADADEDVRGRFRLTVGVSQ